jgi:O-antigen/teichoic acid export membrane protein
MNPPVNKEPTTNLRRVAGNMASILSSNVAIRATNFFMYILVGRYLGVFQFGQLALALSLLFSVHRFALAGLKTLITREIARDRDQTGMYFINASAVVAVASLLCTVGMVIFVRLLGYHPDTATVILLLFLGLAPYTLAHICEAVFQAWERMELIAYVQVPLNLLQFGGVVALLVLGYEVRSVVILIAASYFIILLINWWLVLRLIEKPRLKVDLQFSLDLVKAALPFLGIDGTIAFKASITVVLISRLLGEAEVGIFSAASQLLAPLALIYDSVVKSIFPVMVRRFKAGVHGLRVVTEKMLEFLFTISFPAVIGLFFTAAAVLMLLYNDPDFLQGVTVLRILVWMPLGDAITTALGQALWASDHEKTALRITVVNTVVKSIVSFLLITQYGLIGAALASPVVLAVNLVQHYVPVAKLLSGIQISQLIWRPLLATTGLAAFLVLTTQLNILLRIPGAALVYALCLALVFIASSGGLGGFKTRYQALWVKGERS